MDQTHFKELFLNLINNIDNPFHPLVWINGLPEIGSGTYIGGFSEINAKGAKLLIGDNCDIASFVAINVADSHRRCIGLESDNEYRDIFIGNNVFIGSHAVVLGGAIIGHNSVIASGAIVRNIKIPPFSLVLPDCIKPEYYRKEFEAKHGVS
ncbi:hypothetical protein [Polynucleobacter sp. JS-JIR-II-50]|jgi:acetyltransferase-like isoleucine patch superfamily enzyme|uniref:acyltransferase n=1 Tax=Polynucleobacter sp. JS-JIR-II-50 TaxID=2576919 RepID=UPI001BFCEBAB|nr:hypothetical protein [Polynucleobacter sp. JS-JIR-II-50]QWE04789.1 acyltransferase [Polynucleobacter sp. JS-JIR-II-50]